MRRIVERDRAIRDVISVRERERPGRVVDHPAATHESRDRIVGEALRPWHMEAKAIAIARNVPLPAEPHQREPLTQEQQIAQRVRIRRQVLKRSAAVVEVGKGGRTSTVHHLYHPDAAAHLHHRRLHQDEPGPGLHLAVFIARRKVQIRDPGILRVRRIKRKVYSPANDLVSPVRTGRLAVVDQGSLVDLHAHNAGLGGGRREHPRKNSTRQRNRPGNKAEGALHKKHHRRRNEQARTMSRTVTSGKAAGVTKADSENTFPTRQ